ncbi:hypothetical protein Adt_05907 [Abeliophyllum distichum]|uniref:Uncharacterized protein n=1 Tax=Abeliophyllum distichum TaxID=126358 RepID=A0ABD1V5E7_9LAMI
MVSKSRFLIERCEKIRKISGLKVRTRSKKIQITRDFKQRFWPNRLSSRRSETISGFMVKRQTKHTDTCGACSFWRRRMRHVKNPTQIILFGRVEMRPLFCAWFASKYSPD